MATVARRFLRCAPIVDEWFPFYPPEGSDAEHQDLPIQGFRQVCATEASASLVQAARWGPT